MTLPITKIKKDVSIEDKKRVLRKALIRVAERLELSRQELSMIVGPSESTWSRIFNPPYQSIDPSSKEGELAVLLIRLYKNLDVLFGGNVEQCRQWLRNENTHLGKAPIKLIQSTLGLTRTVEYLEAMRDRF